MNTGIQPIGRAPACGCQGSAPGSVTRLAQVPAAETILPEKGLPETMPPDSIPDGCFLPGCPIAMAYVPVQRFEGLYSPCEGLRHGTIFEALDLPFEGVTVSTGCVESIGWCPGGQPIPADAGKGGQCGGCM